MIEVALQISLVFAVAMFFVSRNQKHVMRFAITYIAIPTFLISMKTTVHIRDARDPMRNYAVGNVPYVVALPGWAATTFMHALTSGIEVVFQQRDNQNYSTSGMVFGSELYTLLRSTNADTIELQSYWRDFFHNCVMGDIRINRKYTMEAFTLAPDLIGFLEGHSMSPIRGLHSPQGDYRTYREALPEISQAFESEATSTISKLGTYVLGREGTLETAFLRNSIENTHHDLLGSSRNAVDALKQNMAINMTRWNIQNSHHGVATNYAHTSNQMQTTTMWANIGLQAKEFVPMMHTIALVLFTCFGSVVVIIALLPNMALPVLKNYFATFFYLGTWPMIFTIMNAIMLWF